MTTDDPLENGAPPLADHGAAVPEDAMSLLTWTGTPAVGGDTAPVVKEGTPVATDTAPPVVAGDIFVGTDKSTPRTALHSRSKPATVTRAIRVATAYILLLAILGAAGIAAFVLVQGTWMVTPVLSGSMRPGLSVGGVVVSQRVSVDSLNVRDVIIFNDPYKSAEQIVHRIVKITKSPGGKLLFDTQGDANTVRDPWTLSIIGKTVYRVRWSVPLLGYVANDYQNHRGFFLLGVGILLILVALSVLFEERQRRGRHVKGGGATKGAV